MYVEQNLNISLKVIKLLVYLINQKLQITVTLCFGQRHFQIMTYMYIAILLTNNVLS